MQDLKVETDLCYHVQHEDLVLVQVFKNKEAIDVVASIYGCIDIQATLRPLNNKET